MDECTPLLRASAASSSPYEATIGFSRAVRAGGLVVVSGTAPLGPDGTTVGRGDAATQARRCFVIAREALEGLGSGLGDAIRTRIYLKRVEDWPLVAAVHGEFFRDVRPVCTVVQVGGFIDPEWLVEVEIDAVASSPAPRHGDGDRACF